MNSLFPRACFALALLGGVRLANGALIVKPNVAPVVKNPIGNYQQYNQAVRVIDLAGFFRDPDASNAVRLTTSLGAMDLTLDGETAPVTVANFLNYVNSGRYFKVDPTNGALASLFFHRSVPNFVIQNGGYLGTVSPVLPTAIQPTTVTTFPAVKNEPVLSNRRGTIAMAKLSGDPNSATSQWFINLADNSGGTSALDTQNGGFTVFGRVAGNGMSVADAIAALPRYLFGTSTGPFSALPLRDYTLSDYNNHKPVGVPNLVSIPAINIISPLQFSATSSNPAVATATVSGTRLLVRASQLGSAQITVTATDLDGAAVSQSFAVTTINAPGRLLNISTRANFPVGNEALTAGFIVNGGPSNQLVVRAVSFTAQVENPLNDMALEVFNGQGQVIASNDNWGDSPDAQLLRDLQIAPQNARETAVFLTVPSAQTGVISYTARVRSADGKPGRGLVEIYSVDSGPGSTLRNISTLGPVGTGADVLIGGFILRGNDSRRLIVRALGPSLTKRNVPGALANPKLELYNSQGVVINSNDDWQTDSGATEIQQFGIAPEEPKEAAIIATLPAGAYTAKVIGVGNTKGIGQIEVYQVQ